MKHNPVIWFEIFVDDINRAQNFYESVLGVSLQKHQSPNSEECQMLLFPMEENAIGAGGALVKMNGIKACPNSSTRVYFSCEDCTIEGSRVEKAGGKICKEKMSIGEHGFIILATDTEGNSFGLHSLK